MTKPSSTTRFPSWDELPIGWTDKKAPGHYRLKKRDDQAYFAYNSAPHSCKKELFPPQRKLWQGERKEGKKYF